MTVNNSTTVCFNELPNEMVVQILGNLDGHNLSNVSRVNSSLKKIVESSFMKKIEETIKYDILLKIHNKKVSFNPKIETLVFQHGFFGRNIERILNSIPRKKILTSGLVPNDYRYRHDRLSIRDACVAYLELKKKTDLFSRIEETIRTNNNQNEQQAIYYVLRSEAKRRFRLLITIEVISKLCFETTSVFNYSGCTLLGTEKEEESLQKELNTYLEDLKQTEPNTYKEFEEFANSILPDLLTNNLKKNEDRTFLNNMLQKASELPSLTPIFRDYNRKLAFDFLREIERIGFANYSQFLKQKSDEKEQEIRKLLELSPNLPIVQSCFSKTRNLIGYAQFFVHVLSLDDPIEIMVADIIDSTPALKSKEGEDNVIKMLAKKLQSYNILYNILYEDIHSNFLGELIDSMKLLYVLDESTYFGSVLILLSNLIKHTRYQNKKLESYQLKVIQSILCEIFDSNLKFITISNRAFKAIATQKADVNIPFIDMVCNNFSGYFDNRLIQRISLLMPCNTNLEKVQHPILQLFKKFSYAPPAAAKLFTTLKFDSEEEKIDAVYQFLEKIPDYKCWKEDPLIAHNFKSAASMEKTGQLLLLYILNIPFDNSLHYNKSKVNVPIDQENIQLLLPFIDLFMKKFPTALSKDNLQKIQTWLIENHHMGASKFFVFNEFRQVGFSSKLIDLLNLNQSFSRELIELIKNPKELFTKTNYFTFDELPQEFKNEEIALIMLERELRGIRSGSNIPFIIKDVKKFFKSLGLSLRKEFKFKMARKFIKVCVEMNERISNCGLLTHHHFRTFTKDNEEIIELYRYLIEMNPKNAKSLNHKKETNFLYFNFTNQSLSFNEELKRAQLESDAFKQYHDQIKEMIETVSKPKKRTLQEKNPPPKRRKKT